MILLLFELIPLKHEKKLNREFFCTGQLDFALNGVQELANENFQENNRYKK